MQGKSYLNLKFYRVSYTKNPKKIKRVVLRESGCMSDEDRGREEREREEERGSMLIKERIESKICIRVKQ